MLSAFLFVLLVIVIMGLLYREALIYGYEHGGIWGFIRMYIAMLINKLFGIFFHG